MYVKKLKAYIWFKANRENDTCKIAQILLSAHVTKLS